MNAVALLFVSIYSINVYVYVDNYYKNGIKSIFESINHSPISLRVTFSNALYLTSTLVQLHKGARYID